MKKHALLLVLCLCTLITVLSSCNGDDVPEVQPDVTENPDGNTEPDDGTDGAIDGTTSTADEINAALTFNSATFKAGTPPENSNLGDLKINKDTINIWPGIKNRISILNHTGISITGVLVHIPGSEGYHDVEIEMEESNDTLAIFYVDIDPEGLDLPFNSGILIKPTDDSGQVIDEFDSGTHVDRPFDGDADTSTDGTGQSNCSPAANKNLYWIYTTHDNSFFNAPNFPFYTSDYSVDGCCESGASSISCHPAPENASVLVNEQYERTDLELIKFFADGDGDFAYQLYRTYNDYWPEDTDFCSEAPGYRLRKPQINTIGKYIVNEESTAGDMVTIVITDIDFTTDELLETGFGPITKRNEGNPQINYFLGCRYYIETILVEGKDILRVFENVEDFDLWYD